MGYPDNELRALTRKVRGFTLIEILTVLLIAGIMVAGGYPKLTNFLWQIKLEQEARMIYQDLLLFMEATVAAGPGDSVLPRHGVVVFDNHTYAAPFGKRTRRYSLLDPLNMLSEVTKVNRNIASDGFCIILTNSSNQPLNWPDDTLEMQVTADGKIATPSVLLNLQIKSFDPDTGETDDSDSWNIQIDPDENRIRLRH